jgi:hypothetical protein
MPDGWNDGFVGRPSLVAHIPLFHHPNIPVFHCSLLQKVPAKRGVA